MIARLDVPAMLALGGVVLVLVASPVSAQPADSATVEIAAAEIPGLPIDVLENAVDALPETRSAAAGRDAAQATAAELRAGPHEWNAYGSGQRRSVDDEGRYSEWEVGVERGLRTPAKRSLDVERGDLAVQLATAAYASARLAGGERVVEAWFRCLAAASRARHAVAAEHIAKDTIAAVRRRQELGDASQLDLALAATEQATARAEGTAARLALDAAQRELQAYGVELDCTGVQPFAPPSAATSEPGSARWASDADPAVRGAEAAAGLAAAEAERARAERVPDPTLGLYYGRERDAAEKIVGARVAVPLPGARQRAVAGRTMAEARAAVAEADARRRDAALRIAQLEADARRGPEIASAKADTAAQQQEIARLQWRAYELGEADLADALQARSRALPAAVDADAAILDAWRARALLALRKAAAAAAAESVTPDPASR